MREYARWPPTGSESHFSANGTVRTGTDDAYEVCIDMPDYDAADIGVRWHDSRLHVSAENHEDGDTRVYNRCLSLPQRVDADAVTASYQDGVLEVRLPVVEDREPPGTQIEVTDR